jgi:hypothetical protein
MRDNVKSAKEFNLAETSLAESKERVRSVSMRDQPSQRVTMCDGTSKRVTDVRKTAKSDHLS